MSLVPSDIVADAAKVLNDLGYDRWSQADLVGYLNNGLLQIALVRPDAFSKTESVLLAEGTRQTIPTTGLRLLDVVRNMGANGSTPGYPITKTDRDSLDLFNRLWHKQTGKAAVKNYFHDERTPKDFYVAPPVQAAAEGAVYAEIIYAKIPTPVDPADLITPIAVDDVYRGPLKDWILRDAFAVEIASQASQTLSARYEQSFYNGLGIKTKSDIGFSPNAPKPSELA